MRKHYILLVVLTILILGSLGSDLLYGNNPVETYPDSTGWMVELPVWVPGFRGAMSWGNIEITGGDGSGFLDNIFDSSTGVDFYFVGKLRYSYQKWRFQWDIFGGQIDNSVKFVFQDGSLIDAKIAAILPRLLAGYRILEKDFDNKNSGSLSSYIYGGIRLYHLGISASPPQPFDPLDLNTTWINPLLGFSFTYNFRKLTLSTQFDIGLIHAFSNSSWWLQLQAGYRVGQRFFVSFGWVLQHIYRTDELLNYDFRYKASLTGPMVGIAFYL